ncbi:hypothetical protein ACYFX5_03715 [Bremerella sp. T1]|uniref:hypothetical protein n=1 Tax=Bremerella sp. TYQ1 TaxID=3119568 RepID=UPI001CD012CC|nr:hypothetical protein [Bremerella volcania]UBM37379.1 hypothetical protein LA756_05670 [Bremerella volcania]
MVLDQVKALEARWRDVNKRLELLRVDRWWHVGSKEDCKGRMLLELDEIEYELGCIQNGCGIDGSEY